MVHPLERPLLAERPLWLRVLSVIGGPLVLGAVAGWALGTSSVSYLAISVVAIAGGILGGAEHRTARGAALRGLAGGLLFGSGILAVDALTGADRTIELPHPAVLLLVLTTVPAVPLHLLGRRLRARRAAAAPRPDAAAPSGPSD